MHKITQVTVGVCHVLVGIYLAQVNPGCCLVGPLVFQYNDEIRGRNMFMFKKLSFYEMCLNILLLLCNYASTINGAHSVCEHTTLAKFVFGSAGKNRQQQSYLFPF